MTAPPAHLLGQSAINLVANVFSAAFGLVNVMVFTRLFAPAAFGVYVLGAGFATIVSIFLSSWLRLTIMREQARGDGTDVRGQVAVGFAASCVVTPAAFLAAPAAGIAAVPAVAAVAFALAISYFELTLELLRARLAAFTVMKATMLRAGLVPLFGFAFTAWGDNGALLLAASALAWLLAAVAFTRSAWAGTVWRFDARRLWELAGNGLPLTVSLTLLAVSGMMDRFIVAYFAGAARAGEYAAGVDLIRQSLIIPAVSLAAAFFPLSVQILANRGADAVRRHLEECLELLAAVTLPACIGLAIVSGHVANVVLGPQFRSMAGETMPIVSIAVIFQILTYQYLHISFLLSNRNAFYLINTGLTVAFNVVIAGLLTARYGAVGAAWARLAADLFGFLNAVLLTRRAFPVPLGFGRLGYVVLAAIVMAIVVKVTDSVISGSDLVVLAILGPIGAAAYALPAFFANVADARDRLRHAVTAMRGRLAH